MSSTLNMAENCGRIDGQSEETNRESRPVSAKVLTWRRQCSFEKFRKVQVGNDQGKAHSEIPTPKTDGKKLN